uniref:DDE_3 domain-containing protein n=1 Tax=Heterorhabditis bacteriophora TaxID=37862 RepID=A0A1I7XA55_HETBA
MSLAADNSLCSSMIDIMSIIKTITKHWLLRRNRTLIDWPSQLPDLDLMENLWGILVRPIYALNRQFSSIENLRKTFSEVWSKIDAAMFKNQSTSMTEGIFQVISRMGSCVDY